VPRVLLLLPTTSYRTPDFLAAAENLGVEVTVGSEEPSTLERWNPAGLIALDFQDPAACAERAAAFAALYPVDAVLGVDEETAVVASAIAAVLGLRQNPESAVRAARHKGRMREALARAGVPAPLHRLFRSDEDPSAVAAAAAYPCVLKPTFLAASRGVIRADDRGQFESAWRRIVAILAEPDVARRGEGASREILVEDFVGGREVALEGLLESGALRVLALFDKPDPLDGPFFEETIYVTPSRLPAPVQAAIAACASDAAAALGLREGPVHAELRINEEGPWLVEVAGRSIGGLCSKTLRFGTGVSLEELILRQACGMDVQSLSREQAAGGVMMIPIPEAGILRGVAGVEEAAAVPGVEEIDITAQLHYPLVPLPEGDSYLGFIFARGSTPADVEAALREAHSQLRFDIEPGILLTMTS
jgi:biotin carboxylase